MKLKAAASAPSRAYRQTARAQASAAREAGILVSFRALLGARWMDEFTLQDVARDAGVTQQTVIRKFGGKEGLLEALVEQVRGAVDARRAVAPGAIDRALDVLLDDYEADGDFVMRMLRQEARFPVLGRFLDVGRTAHRTWVAGVFEPWLAPLERNAKREALDTLVAASDLYVWHLLRRDLGFERPRVRAAMRRLMGGALTTLKTDSI